MKIAYVTSAGPAPDDGLLARVARDLDASGWRTCGVVQTNLRTGKDHRCDMDLKILPDGPTIRISQSLGPGARGCRLNPSALEQAVAASQHQLARAADVLIVNKFGKHEAEGRGFRGLIAEAVAGGVPVILGVSAQNLEAFLEYTQGLATCVAPTTHDIAAWLRDPATQSDAA